jgi:hypothetical protein
VYNIKLSYYLALALAVSLYIAFLTIDVVSNILLTILITLKLRLTRFFIKVIKVHRLVAISLVYT